MDAASVGEREAELNANSKFDINIDDKTFSVTKDMVTPKRYQKTVHVEDFVPSVIEPSFGIGRVTNLPANHDMIH